MIRLSVIASLALASLLVSYVIVHAWPGHLNIAQNGWANARLLAARILSSPSGCAFGAGPSFFERHDGNKQDHW
jgi:hypothetical protein